MIDAPLIMGGTRDESISALLAAFRRRHAPVTVVLSDDPPELDWELGGSLRIGGEAVAPRSIFSRHDVFASMADSSPRVAVRAMAWTATITGYALATGTRTPNAAPDPRAGSKPATLVLAAALGLAVPPTRITNSRAALGAFEPAICKPVAGGDYARRRDDAIALATPTTGPAFRAPAILQPELVPPELRLFAVGDAVLAFEVRSPNLDYRTGPADVIAVAPPAHLVAPFLALARALGLDFCAADFKSARTGELLLLEVNTGPMFARFDHAAAGALTDAIADWLLR